MNERAGKIMIRRILILAVLLISAADNQICGAQRVNLYKCKV